VRWLTLAGRDWEEVEQWADNGNAQASSFCNNTNDLNDSHPLNNDPLSKFAMFIITPKNPFRNVLDNKSKKVDCICICLK
jgi:hypothetical protein